MLIHWGWDENCPALIASGEFAVKVSELLRAHRRGNHLLVVERKLIAELAQLDISAADKALLARLSHEYTQTGALHRVSTAYIRVGNNVPAKATRVGSAFVVPFDLLVSSRLLDVPALLVENVDTDGWLLGLAIQAVAERSQRGVVAFEPYHGGGDDLPKVLAHLIRSGRAVYAIVDSDKDSPFQQAIPKLRRMRRILDVANWVAAEGAALPCREIENIVPRSVLTQVQSALGLPANSITLNIEIAETNAGALAHDRYWLFLDLKNGHRPERMDGYDENTVQWLSSKLNLAGLDAATDAFVGYGDNVVSQIAQDGSLAAQARRSFAETGWRGTFVGFFDPLCWFFLSAGRLIT